MRKGNMSDQKIDYFSLNAKLCRLVQANPCMYDKSSPNYLKKEYVERAWANIAREVKDSVGSCKERWRNIRTAYARSVNIYKTPSGPNRHKRYYLHDELQFLTKHISPGQQNLPIRVLSPSELEENHENSQHSVDESYDNCIYQITIDPSSTPPPSQVEEETNSTSEQEYADPPVSSSAKRRKTQSYEDSPIDSVKTQSSTNLDLEFLKSLLPEMKVMNARQKIVFKGKIFRALEEIFADTRDFPSKIEMTAPISTGTTLTNERTSVQETNVVNTFDGTRRSNISSMSSNHTELNIKEETISVDLAD